MVASALLYAVVCWSSGSSERDRKRLNKLVRRAGSVLDCSLDSIEEVGDRRMLAKLTSIMDDPLNDSSRHQTVQDQPDPVITCILDFIYSSY